MPPLNPRSERTFRHALRRATLDLKDVAAEMGAGWSTLELYVNRARPSRAMAVRLRAWLEQHARELQQLARQLPGKEPKA